MKINKYPEMKFIAALLFILPFSGISYSQIICNASVTDTINKNSQDEVFKYPNVRIDTMPIFNPGFNLDFRQWINSELNKRGLMDKCPVGMDINVIFLITSSGFIEDIQIENNASVFSNVSSNLSVICINSIKQIFKDSEKYWTPGNHNGIPVSVQFSLPIRLRLNHQPF
jgi:hypothetical protein